VDVTQTPTATQTPTKTPTVKPSSTAAPTQVIIKPGESINAAISKAQPGTTIYIRAGTYNQKIEITGKTGLLLAAYPGEIVTIDGTNKASAGIEVRGSSGITVDGLTITKSGYEGVLISGSDHIVITNTKITASGGVGFHITSQYGPSTYNTLKNSEVTGSKEEGVYLDVKTANPLFVDFNVIENVYIHHNGWEGLQNTNQNGVDPRPNYNTFIGNRIEYNGNDWAAVDLSGAGLMFSGNTVINDKARAGAVWAAEIQVITIRDNVITNSYRNVSYGDAIVLSNTVGATVTGNRIMCKTGMCVSGINKINSNTVLLVGDNTVVWK
jgi:parallel beta-helix repeat protein